MLKAYLVDVLAGELRDELVEAVAVGLDTNGLEDLLDVAGGRGLLTTEGKEKVGSEVLHDDGILGPIDVSYEEFDVLIDVCAAQLKVNVLLVVK